MITNTDNAKRLIERLEATEHILKVNCAGDPDDFFYDEVPEIEAKIARTAKNHTGFNMCAFMFHCGAPACLAGHAWDLHNGSGSDIPLNQPVPKFLADFLGCSEMEADALYSGYFARGKPMSHITPAEAVQALREMM